MDQQEISCRKHDLVIQATSDAIVRTCLSCGLFENFQSAQGERDANPWQGWLRAHIKPLSWPPSVEYGGVLRARDVRPQQEVYSHRPNNQTSLRNEPQMDRNPYIYRDLTSLFHIRLLELSQGNKQDTLSGRLFRVHWNPKTSPSYSALSYTWADDKGDTSLSNIIFLDEGQKVLHITRNCYRALRSLRQKTKSVFLWVDSICINQSSPSERSHQVGLMKTIYSNATAVHSYVGETQCGEDLTGIEAMVLLKHLQLNGISEMLSSSKTDKIVILNRFFSRSYFARLWIVQELLLAQSIVIHCGEVSLTITDESISQLHEQGIKVPSWVRFAGKLKFNTERTPMDLRELLTATTVCRVTDLRDKVFGLLGLVNDIQATDLIPDYELMVREVYIGVAAYLIQNDCCCDLIQNANAHWSVDPVFPLQKDNAYGIPSWVPMWDTDMPLQTSQGIFREFQQIELDCEKMRHTESKFDHFAIRTIDGWSHDSNSQCSTRDRSCKMVDSRSGSLATSIEIVFRLYRSFCQNISRNENVYEMDSNESFTFFWSLNNGFKLAIRSFAWALKWIHCGIENAYLIRIEGCATLFLARKMSDHSQYSLLCPCIAALLCPSEEPSPTKMFECDDLQRFTQFTPLELEMVQFLAKWRNRIIAMAESLPEHREDVLSMQDQSSHYLSGDESETTYPAWRTWKPFLALETASASESNKGLQKQLSELFEFWSNAPTLNNSIHSWTINALSVTNEVHFNKRYNSHDILTPCLESHLRLSNSLSETFQRTAGSRASLRSIGPLEQLIDLLTDPEVSWKNEDLVGYPGAVKGLFQDCERFCLLLEDDRKFFDQAFPLKLKGVHHMYSTVKKIIEMRKRHQGLLRGSSEVQAVLLI